jgi:hypothetical protein
MSKSLTAAAYHLKCATDYLLDFKRCCESQAKNRAHQWVNKSEYLVRDIYQSIPEDSRKVFEQELLTGDPLFYGAITETLMRMTPEQREQVEVFANQMLKQSDVSVNSYCGNEKD